MSLGPSKVGGSTRQWPNEARAKRRWEPVILVTPQGWRITAAMFLTIREGGKIWKLRMLSCGVGLELEV